MICGSSDLYYKIISIIMRKRKKKLSIFKERTMAGMCGTFVFPCTS